MNTSHQKTVFTGMLAAAVVALCAAAQAGEHAGESTTKRAKYTVEKPVSYADLDLNSHQGREALAGRISEAAREVCGPTDYRMTGSLRITSRNRACVEQAVSDAIGSLCD